jgi:hypothetical protein
MLTYQIDDECNRVRDLWLGPLGSIGYGINETHDKGRYYGYIDVGSIYVCLSTSSAPQRRTVLGRHNIVYGRLSGRGHR